MARWTQPHEVRKYARVSHAFIDAMAESMDLLVVDQGGAHHTGRLIQANMRQEPAIFPPSFAGEFTIEDKAGLKQTFDLLDVKDVYPLFTPEQAAAQIPAED